MTDALDIIRRAADRLDGDEDAGVQLVADWLRDGARGDLVEFLGAVSTRGHSARRELAIAARNEALQHAAALLDGPSPAERARVLSRQLSRYRAGAWRHDREKPHCPSAGSLRSLLFAALRAVDRDLGARQIDRILAEPRLASTLAEAWPNHQKDPI